MPFEIEKKFLVNTLPEHLMTDPIEIRQGYLVNGNGILLRVRTFGDQAFLTIKSPTIDGVRKEFEYPVPRSEAIEMLDTFCRDRFIEKVRYRIPHAGFVWELDCFSGLNSGLAVAEIELDRKDRKFEKPDWIGAEVTDDHRYANSNLISYPFILWPENRSG